MPRKKVITLAFSAVRDLEEILTWYANQALPEMGERLLKEIISRMERLADFPESGRIVPEFGISNLREIIHPPYRIVYRLDENRLRIIRILRSERLLEMA